MYSCLDRIKRVQTCFVVGEKIFYFISIYHSIFLFFLTIIQQHSGFFFFSLVSFSFFFGKASSTQGWVFGRLAGAQAHRMRAGLVDRDDDILTLRREIQVFLFG